ncbi:MAG: 30S ribosomal protein S2 [Parcubacteria group bacterium GW2011_GWF2_44_8]|nr:MAG: 30S ribosomal protein S2 [Parcubacteria group bacterium GW2011_GWF2_44_8]
MEMPTLREMLDAGVHFGHKTSRWFPKMAPYIYTSKAGVHVINLEKTADKLKEALNFIEKEAAAGKVFIFVGTKKQSGDIVKEAAIAAGMPYVSSRWLGGTITNFEAIKSSTKKFKKQKEELENESSSNLNKSEISKLRKEVARGEKFLGGLVGLERKPDGLILFGSHDEKNALKEAKCDDIPVIAIVDTNADPTQVEFPIPANDDATKSVKLFADLIAKTIKEATASRKAEAAKTEASSK